MRSLWPRRQHRRLASSLSTVRKQNSSRFGLTPTSYATGLPLALVQLQPAPIRTPRRRRKTMMLQAFGVKSMKPRARKAHCITPGTPCHGSGPGAAEKRSFSCPGAAKWSLVDKAPRTPELILVYTSHGPERRLARSVRLAPSRLCRAAQGIWRRAATDCKHSSPTSIIAANNANCNELLQLIRT